MMSALFDVVPDADDDADEDMKEEDELKPLIIL